MNFDDIKREKGIGTLNSQMDQVKGYRGRDIRKGQETEECLYLNSQIVKDHNLSYGGSY